MTLIETRRLRLRPLRHDDFPDLVRALDNLNVSRMTARIPHPYRTTDAEAFLAMCARPQPGTLRLSITRGDGPDRIIGGIGYEADATGAAAELGYWLAEPHWGHGYASEAGAAMVAHAFGPAGHRKLVARYRNDNPASGRVLAKLGFVVTGSVTCTSIAIAGCAPATAVELTRDQWQALGEEDR